MTDAVCVACRRGIDATAKLCPYCGANPMTGERVDTQAMLEEVFRPKEVTSSEAVMEYARQRQGLVVLATVVVAFLILWGMHEYLLMRSRNETSEAPPVSLAEIADINQQNEETRKAIPDLPFQYDGRPQTMRTFVVEQGAVIPPEIVAAQQAAQAAAQAAAQPAPAAAPPTAAPRPPAATPPRPQ